MEYLSNNVLAHWLANTPILVNQLCVVVVIAYMAIRLRFIRRAIHQAESNWIACAISALFFGILAMTGSYNGIIIDFSEPEMTMRLPEISGQQLKGGKAILGYRDAISLSAGLCGGPWVGLGAGLISGLHRYSLGGFVATASGLATMLLGLGAGLSKRYWSKAVTPLGTLCTALAGTGLHRFILLLSANFQSEVLWLTWETLIPITVVNCLGCLVFRLVIQDLDRDRLKYELKQQALAQRELKFLTRQAEYRALQAQIEPHFINNTLNAIKALIRINAEQAADYIVKLAHFLDDTRQLAKVNAISLEQELTQLSHYLAFQKLRFPDAFQFHLDVAEPCLDYYVPPRCLLTLAENALIHGKDRNKPFLLITVRGRELDEYLLIDVIDNGKGISARLLPHLGHQPVSSERGSGNGLYYLRESLQLAFDGAATLTIQNGADTGAQVTLTLPKRRQRW